MKDNFDRESLSEAYEDLQKIIKKYKSNVKIVKINEKIKKGKIKTLRQLFEALDIPWIAYDQYGRGMKDKPLPKGYQISLFKY